MGMSERAAKQYVSMYGDILRQVAGSDTELFNMSTALTQLAGDMASFYNMDSERIFDAISAVFRGEYDPIQRYIATMNDAAIATHAVETGLVDSQSAWKKANESTKIMARYSFLMANTTHVQGDFAKTSDSYANQLAQFQATIENLKAAVGSELLPALTSIIDFMNKLFGGSEDASDGIEMVKETYKDSIGSIEATAANALALVNALQELSAASEDAAQTETWQAILSELENTIPGIGDLIDDQTGKIEGGSKALEDYVNNWKALSLESAKQKAMQSLYDEYAELALEAATLRNEQTVADVLEKSNTKTMQTYERQFRDTMIKGLQAYNVDQSLIDQLLQKSWNLGATSLFNQYANNPKNNPLRLMTMDVGLFKQYKLSDLWAAGGGTLESFELIAETWSTFKEQYAQYRAVDNAAKIAELEGLIATQETEINTLLDYYDAMFGDILGQPATPAVTDATAEPEPAPDKTGPEAVIAAADAAVTAADAAVTAADTATKAAETATDQPPMNITINLTLDGVVEQTVALTMEEIARQTRTKSQTN
jgi:signal transduction histidine kinase